MSHFLLYSLSLPWSGYIISYMLYKWCHLADNDTQSIFVLGKHLKYGFSVSSVSWHLLNSWMLYHMPSCTNSKLLENQPQIDNLQQSLPNCCTFHADLTYVGWKMYLKEYRNTRWCNKTVYGWTQSSFSDVPCCTTN